MNYVEALDDMTATFYTAWQANAAAIAGNVPDIRFPGISEPKAPPNAVWGRWFYKTLGQPQTTLRTSKKRMTAFGYCGLQLFGPLSKADSLRVIQLLGNMVKNSLAGHSLSGHVWFRNARIDELAPDAVFSRLNVVADFEYDELI